MADKKKKEVAKGGTEPDALECRITGSRAACCGTGDKDRCADDDDKKKK